MADVTVEESSDYELTFAYLQPDAVEVIRGADG